MKVVQLLRHKYRLSELLRLTGLAKSTYYHICTATERLDKYSIQKELIQEIFAKHRKRYRNRRITETLKLEY